MMEQESKQGKNKRSLYKNKRSLYKGLSGLVSQPQVLGPLALLGAVIYRNHHQQPKHIKNRAKDKPNAPHDDEDNWHDAVPHLDMTHNDESVPDLHLDDSSIQNSDGASPPTTPSRDTASTTNAASPSESTPVKAHVRAAPVPPKMTTTTQPRTARVVKPVTLPTPKGWSDCTTRNRSTAAETPTPKKAVARVSAATLRNIKSRQRGRPTKQHQEAVAVRPFVATTAAASPKAPSSPTVAKTTCATTTCTPTTTSTTTPPVSVVDTSIVFKVFYTNCNMHFHVPFDTAKSSYSVNALRQAIAKALQINDKNKDFFVIYYMDEEGDECVLSSNDDVEQAISAHNNNASNNESSPAGCHDTSNKKCKLTVKLVNKSKVASTLTALWKAVW
mgnify:CR=1 FL=1